MSDSFAQQFLDAPDTREALGWLNEDTTGMQRFLGEGLPAQQARDFVQGLYDAGAKQVWVVKIDSYDDGMENSGKMLIELPDDTEQRSEILLKADEINLSQGFDPIEDEGQRYVFLMLD